MMRKQLKFKNQVAELQHVNLFVEEICDELGLDMELQMNLNLALEEVVSNVIFYAYPEGTTADIELLAEYDGKVLTLVLSDQGKHFIPRGQQPTSNSLPNTTAKCSPSCSATKGNTLTPRQKKTPILMSIPQTANWEAWASISSRTS